VEPPGSGDCARYLLPRLQASRDNNNSSGLFGWLNANKQSIALDMNDADDAVSIAQICAGAQVVIHSTVDEQDDTTVVNIERLRKANPQTVFCNVTFFGQTGPYRNYIGNDALCTALSGLAFGIGEADGPPTLPSGYGPQIIAGVTATIAVMAALIGSKEESAANDIDLSVLESTLVLNETGAIARSYELGSIPRRFGVNRFPPTYPMGVFKCADGWLGVTALTPAQWGAFCELLELPEYATNPRYFTSIDRFINADELEGPISDGILKWSARELVVAGQEKRVPLTLVPTPEELLSLPEFVERGALSNISLPGGSEFQAPGIPFILERTPAIGSGTSPDLDGNREEVLNNLVKTENSNSSSEAELQPPSIKPLEGIRIIDLSKGWSGPLAARYCADLGADVIKVEDCRHPDWWRGWEATRKWVDEREYEKMPSFNSMNRNKLGITLDLTTSEGKDLVKLLIKDADAVIENYTSTVLPKLGLDYAELKKINPEIVMISMPAWGMSSAWSDHRAYGSTVEQASGLPHLNGRKEWPPTHQHVALGDAVSGINAAVAVLIALYHKQQTGEGQFIDLSQIECLLPLGAHGMIEYSLNKTDWPRLGSKHPEYSPYGIYPCDGDEAWLTITCTTDDHWQALATTMNMRQLLQDKRFTNATTRKENEDDLDAIIAAWTIKLDPQEAMTVLQSAVVPAAVVRSTQNLVDDPQLQSRGYFEWGKGVHRDLVLYPLPAFTMNGHRQQVRWPAPKLGEHNREVLKGKLGLSDDEVQALVDKQIIGTVPIIPGE
jgi:crotonobetainyl-CoA:carnitine CoA-transferase CaiB-like acyl-CoA transferase